LSREDSAFTVNTKETRGFSGPVTLYLSGYPVAVALVA
jgi:hypothetical protein